VKLIFSTPSSLVHFGESLHRISIESLLSKKMFGRASLGFSLEATLGALPNRTSNKHVVWVRIGRLIRIIFYIK